MIESNFLIVTALVSIKLMIQLKIEKKIKMHDFWNIIFSYFLKSQLIRILLHFLMTWTSAKPIQQSDSCLAIENTYEYHFIIRFAYVSG